MRILLTSALLICFCFPTVSAVEAAHTETGGVTFSVGFESYPVSFFYRMEGVRYVSGGPRDYRFNPKKDDGLFSVLSFRARKMIQVGFGNFRAGIEVGMSLPVSGHEMSWSLPPLTPKFTGDIYYGAFC